MMISIYDDYHLVCKSRLAYKHTPVCYNPQGTNNAQTHERGGYYNAGSVALSIKIKEIFSNFGQFCAAYSKK
jgi:hypothetical protein